MVCEDEGGLSVKFTKLTKCSGEAFVNIRKGKMIPSYELELRFGWEGTVKDGNGAWACAQLHGPYQQLCVCACVCELLADLTAALGHQPTLPSQAT